MAASANLPALLLTLYWRKCSTAGVVAGVIGGTVLSIGLVLVSPNMTYPLQQRNAALATAKGLDQKIQSSESGVVQVTADQRAQWAKEAAAARATAASIPENARSWVGLSEPLISLRNPGLISIPIGFLLVILFSLYKPSRYSDSRWVDMAVRRETGLGIAKAHAH